MRSIHVEVRKAVIDGIAADINDDTISITYGWQGSGDDRAREQIYTGNARATHDPAALKAGRNFRDEEMQFDINVLVEAVGEQPDVAEDRVMELGQVVEEFVADRKSNELGIDGLIWIRVSEFASDYRILPAGGSIAIGTWTLIYRARLT